MTDQPFEDREDAPEQPEGVQEPQEEVGYGSDEGEREESLPDE